MLRCIFPTVCLALIAAGSVIFAQDEIVIGEYASLTGGSASFGQSSHKGTALAIDEINAAGGVLGKKLKLITEDDQSQAGQPATIVAKADFTGQSRCRCSEKSPPPSRSKPLRFASRTRFR